MGIRPLASPFEELNPMLKENRCCCAVCQIERSLFDALRTQIARTHFQALALNYPILNHFDSPVQVIAQLHEHEQAERINHKAWNEILHALVRSIARGHAEEIGQQLLLAAYAPAIHKVYREVCQKFPALCPEDIAQQAALSFLETARSPEIQGLNGHLPGALAMRFRRRLFRWAIGELRQSLPLQEIAVNLPEIHARDFEEGIVLYQLLSKAQRTGILSENECELVRKFHCEGFELDELHKPQDGPSAIALYRRIQRAVHRLRRIGMTGSQRAGRIPPKLSHERNFSQPKKILRGAVDFSEEMGIRNSEKGMSPELSHRESQPEPEAPIAA